MSQLRNFEISIWTLQDDFITVIESAWIKNKGKTENASMTLNIDGTQQLTFRVPMYYYVDGKRVANPAWLTFTESKVLLNTRKVKVILNKQTDNEEIYEFVIDKVTEEHDRDEFYCDVDCSGLAFYELGKIGYKVALSEEEFYNDDYNWFIGETDSNGNKLFTEQPVANIQYWLNKFLTPYPSSGNSISAATWYYKIQMNWDLTANFAEFTKDSDKIYENDIYGDTYLLSQEKYRMINLEESNFYNLTQNIAETFGVYCKYVYTYDENYHIIGRTIVFYNNFLDEENLAINYRGNTQFISRELDTTDLVTKMFVRTVDNNVDTTSIIDVEENDLGEDYLLNFDYLYSIGSIDEDAYSAIEPYKTNLKEINVQLKAVSERIINIENKLPEVRARASLAEDSIQLDNEKITANNKLLNSLTGGTGILEITNKNPDTAVLLKEQNADYYYIKLTKTGIDASTVKIYKTLSVTSANNTLTSEIKTAIPVYDDSNNLIRMTNIYWNDDTRSKIVYLTYKYQPSLYYENIIKTWIQKLNKDTQEAEDANNELEALENDLDTATKLQRDLLARKAALNSEFEKLMGPAIREGYWQPEDYSEYVETFIASYKLNNLKTVGGTHYDTFLWDTQLFEGEQDISYKLGIEQAITYYPCINLTNIWDIVKNNLNSLSFVFYDTANTEQYNSVTLRQLSFGSGAQVIFLVKDDNVFPALLLTGLESYNNESITYARENGKIGFVSYDMNGNYHISGGTSGQGTTIKNFWLTLDNTYQAAYPRIRIESMSLKTDTNSLIVRDNGTTILNQYTDYYITTRVDASEHIVDNPIVGSYYITIKPTIVAKTQGLSNHTLEIMFKIADCAIAIYRDAKEILKENSKPKVSYSSTIDILNNNIIYRPSHFLSKIVKINDYDLLLDEAWGYVSGVTLDLDHPEHDNIEIQNYTNKFEDLFTTIVAQTEAMKKTSYIVDTISNSFAPDGSLSANTLQNSLSKVDLNYAFNNGNLTIDEANGIWGTSDSGVVAFRGGGIFTATERDRRNNWIWNTGITPEGINADRITSGQLDTNKIRVFAGDRERFQLNGTGLYGYKSFMSDFDVFYNAGSIDYPSEMRDKIQNDDQVLDPAQFVRFDENGLFLVAKEGAYVLNEDRTEYVIITPQWTDLDGVIHRRLDDDNELKRVAISWDGLTLRNLKGERVFYADSNTGDLKLKGSVFASNFYVIKDDGTTDTFTNYIRINGAEESLIQLRNDLDNNGDIRDRIDTYIDAAENAITEHYDAVTGALQEAIDSANGEIESAKGRISTAEGKISEAEQAIADLDKDLDDSIQLLTDTLTGQQQALTDLTNNYNQFSEDIRDAIVPEVFNGENLPLDQNYKVGDIFYNTITGDEYICTSVSNPKVAGDWTKTSTPIVHGTKLDVNADAGTIEMEAEGTITLKSNNIINLNSSVINMGASEKISLASNGSIDIVSSNGQNEVSTILLKPGDITIAGSSKVTMAGSQADIVGGKVNIDGGEVNVSAASDIKLTSGSKLSMVSSTISLIGTNAIDMASTNINLTATSELKLFSTNLNLTGTGKVAISGPEVEISGSKGLNLVGGSVLNIGTTEEASSLNIASKGKFSAIGGDFWIAATDYDTFNGKSDIEKKSLSYMHGYLGPQDNKYHLDIGSDNLRIMANGSLNMESGGTISIKAGSKIEMLSDTTSGIKMSGNGIDILTNAYLNIAAGALKISSTGSTTSKSIDTYVSDEIASKTNNLITKVDVEYCRSTKSKNLTDDSITVPWSTDAPEWRSGEYIWQRTATYTSDSTQPQPSYSDATCISGADGRGIDNVNIKYAVTDASSDHPNDSSLSWKDNISDVSPEAGQVLWVRTITTYTDNSTDKTYTKTYMGTNGSSVGISSITDIYDSNDPTKVIGKRITFTDTKIMDIMNGEDGEDGKLVGDNLYLHVAWANQAVYPYEGFSTSISTDKKYLGVYRDNNVADSTNPQLYSWTLIKGEDGTGIKEIVEEYILYSDSNTNPPSDTDPNWSSEQPAWDEGYSIWTHSKITWNDGIDTITYTEPVKAEAFNGFGEQINEIVDNSFYFKPKIDFEYGLAYQQTTDQSLINWSTEKPTKSEQQSKYLYGRIAISGLPNGSIYSENYNFYEIFYNSSYYLSESVISPPVELFYYKTDDPNDSPSISSSSYWSKIFPKLDRNCYIFIKIEIRYRRDSMSPGTYTGNSYGPFLFEYVKEIQNEIFNSLTAYGAIQGIFMENEQLYINATYIKSGILSLGGTYNGDGAIEVFNSDNNKIGSWNKDGFSSVGDFTLYSNNYLTSNEEDDFLLKITQDNEGSSVLRMKDVIFDKNTINTIKKTFGSNVVVLINGTPFESEDYSATEGSLLIANLINYNVGAVMDEYKFGNLSIPSSLDSNIEKELDLNYYNHYSSTNNRYFIRTGGRLYDIVAYCNSAIFTDTVTSPFMRISFKMYFSVSDKKYKPNLKVIIFSKEDLFKYYEINPLQTIYLSPKSNTTKVNIILPIDSYLQEILYNSQGIYLCLKVVSQDDLPSNIYLLNDDENLFLKAELCSGLTVDETSYVQLQLLYNGYYIPLIN